MRMRYVNRFSLKAMFLALSLLCICLGFIAHRLQLRRGEMRALDILANAGALEATWGTKRDVFEFEDPFSRTTVFMVTADRYEEGPIGKFTRHLTESVIGLEFEGAAIRKEEFDALRQLKSLIWLDLDNCRIDESVLQQERLPAGIIWLSLYDTSLAKMNRTFLSEASSLEFLDLSGCDVTDSMLEQVSRLSRLRSLNLSSNPKITDVGLKYVSRLENLKVLKLSDTNVTSEGLQHLSQLESLEYVMLLRTQVEEEKVSGTD